MIIIFYFLKKLKIKKREIENKNKNKKRRNVAYPNLKTTQRLSLGPNPPPSPLESKNGKVS